MLDITLGAAIGLVFVFMLFSLFLSTALEAVSALSKLRGRALRGALARLLDDPGAVSRSGGLGRVVSALPQWLQRKPAAPAALRADAVDAAFPERYEAATEMPDGDHAPRTPIRFLDVFCHPLVAGTSSSNKPSYVAAQNFSSALLYSLRGNRAGDRFAEVKRGVAALPSGPLREALQTAVDEAGDNLEVFRQGVERWFDHAMDRLSGEYKRFSQLLTFLAGLGIAVSCNVDAIAIGQRLYVDPVLRAAIEKQATQYVLNGEVAAPGVAASGAASDEDAKVAFDVALNAAQQARQRLVDTISFSSPAGDHLTIAHLKANKTAPIGWLVTALAGMLGAPFWFDLLQKLVNLRGTGPKPEKAAAAKTGKAP